MPSLIWNMCSLMMSLPINQVLLGDCLDILKTIPNDTIDVCFADPPFNLYKKYTKYSPTAPE
jgi:DNA modification methylase